ncbi:hypothetical protein [Brachybacterium kimchii]|uniref:Uncharacterized protein n=1 Tax=Brachybacterium kimchii TaxID=2942909 RepID=A0ABY4N8T3_9MICO|nr:hypothetical protein [Brachybacterium kimchii]UQN30511.1 hypothetical protein M4486_04075 [Brachybacterium kimchii]
MVDTKSKPELAESYISDYWSDCVSDVGLRTAMTEPPAAYDEDCLGGDGLDDYSAIAYAPLRGTLQIPDRIFEAMIVADANIDRKVRAQYDDTLAPGANERYDETWSAHVRNIHIGHPELERAVGVFGVLASCQGGEEVGMIYAHPIHGVRDHMAPEAYRHLSAPYVAAFGVELFHGDLDAGLVLPEVQQSLMSSR